jgi:hypothetical protein
MLQRLEYSRKFYVSEKKNRVSLDNRAKISSENNNPNKEYVRLNRKQICRIEINAAVRMFLIDKDPIPAHLLASAAIEIMVALSDGNPGVGHNDLRSRIKTHNVPKELSDELFQSLQHPYNFLKHGSSDFNIENDFSIEQIAMTIFTSISSYKQLFSDASTEMEVFFGIVKLWRIDWWKGTPEFENIQQEARKLRLFGASYEEVCDFGRDMLQYNYASKG